MSTARRRHFGSGPRLPSGRWQATYWHLGRRHLGTVTFKTKGDALAWLSSVETDIRRGAWTDPSQGTTVGEWLDYWLESVVEGRVGSDNTVANYATIVRVHLKPGLGDVRLAGLTPEQVDDFLASKAKAGRSKSYVARMRNVLADALFARGATPARRVERGQAFGHAEVQASAGASFVHSGGGEG